MSAHTPGPWSLYDARPDGSTSMYVNGPDAAYVGSVHFAPGRANEGSANARLIAAAPELLEALKATLSTMELQVGRQEERYHLSQEGMQRIWNAVVAQGNAAIAKATGEAA